MDGERISGEGADHNVDFSHFNVDEIERIEVIKGAQSTIYGSNALGGVINIITKKANRPFTGNISAHYGDNNSQKYTVSIGTKQKKFSSLTNATHRRKDTYTIQDDNGQIINSTDSVGNMIQSQRDAYSTTVYGYKIWDFSQKFGYAITDKLNADVKGAFYHNERDRQTGKKFQETYTDYSVLGGLKYLITDKQQLQLSYSFDNYQKDKDFFNANFIRTDYRNKNHIARMVYSATLGKHTLFAGVENNYEYLKHYMLKDSADADANNFAIFAQEDWKICPKVDFVVGVRSDHHELYKWHVTPKLSVMYKPLESWTFRGGYSQGFRSPSLKELYQAYDMGGLGWFMLYGNEDLKPETSHQFTVSAEYAKGSMDISANFHHTRYNDKITYAMMNDGTSDRQYINAENAKTTGLEAIGQYKFDFGMTFCASYAYINDYEEVDGRNTSSVRPHSATFSIRYNKKIRKTGISAALNGHWGSSIKTYSYNSDGTYQWITYDARTMCTLMLGVQLPRGINASIGADNLFNYTDKASDSSVQMPRTGISLSASLNINLADLFGI